MVASLTISYWGKKRLNPVSKFHYSEILILFIVVAICNFGISKKILFSLIFFDIIIRIDLGQEL
jgi:hypothetical protein